MVADTINVIGIVIQRSARVVFEMVIVARLGDLVRGYDFVCHGAGLKVSTFGRRRSLGVEHGGGTQAKTAFSLVRTSITNTITVRPRYSSRARLTGSSPS